MDGVADGVGGALLAFRASGPYFSFGTKPNERSSASASRRELTSIS
jgi:hypothetical protein